MCIRVLRKYEAERPIEVFKVARPKEGFWVSMYMPIYRSPQNELSNNRGCVSYYNVGETTRDHHFGFGLYVFVRKIDAAMAARDSLDRKYRTTLTVLRGVVPPGAFVREGTALWPEGAQAMAVSELEIVGSAGDVSYSGEGLLNVLGEMEEEYGELDQK